MFCTPFFVAFGACLLVCLFLSVLFTVLFAGCCNETKLRMCEISLCLFVKTKHTHTHTHGNNNKKKDGRNIDTAQIFVTFPGGNDNNNVQIWQSLVTEIVATFFLIIGLLCLSEKCNGLKENTVAKAFTVGFLYWSLTMTFSRVAG